MLQLAAELLALDKLAAMTARQVRSIADAYYCWRDTTACFEACDKLWGRVDGADPLLVAHRQLLARLICSALDRQEFYHVTDLDRAIFNAGCDHGLPVSSPYAEAQ
jgi:hypothetical protein